METYQSRKDGKHAKPKHNAAQDLSGLGFIFRDLLCGQHCGLVVVVVDGKARHFSSGRNRRGRSHGRRAPVEPRQVVIVRGGGSLGGIFSGWCCLVFRSASSVSQLVGRSGRLLGAHGTVGRQDFVRCVSVVSNLSPCRTGN
jgi:hypothetical protein